MSDDELLGSEVDADDDVNLNDGNEQDEDDSDSDYEKTKEEKHEEIDIGYDTDEDLENYNQDDCLYKNAKLPKKSYVIEDKSLHSSSTKWDKMILVKKEERITGNRMTDYEIVRILSTRTKQLSSGAPPLIEVTNNNNDKEVDNEEIAKLELQHNKTPFIIMRPLPNNFVEAWTVQELFVPDSLWG